MTDETFLTDDDAIEWAKDITVIHHIELVISSHKDGGKKKLLRCFRGEWYRGLLRDLDAVVQRNTKTKACKCPFRVKVQEMRGCGRWRIVAYPGIKGMNNHALSVYPEGHRQMSGLSEASKKLARDMKLSRPSAVHAAIVDQHPEDYATRKQAIAQSFKNGRWRQILEAPTELEYNRQVNFMRDRWSRQRAQVVTYIEETWRTFEESTSKAGPVYSSFPFNHLTCRVSHYCLTLLDAELRRMRELVDEVGDHCGCVLRITHDIPCACELKGAMESGIPISVDGINMFWRTLTMGDQVEQSDDFVGGNDMPEHQMYFQTLVDQIRGSDPAVVRRASLLLHSQLYPNEANYVEPEVNTRVRGRPSRSTRRDPSSWEYSQRGRGHGRSSGRSSSTGRGRSSSSSVNNGSGNDQMADDLTKFWAYSRIPSIISSNVYRYLDVKDDNNCGFRVVASIFFNSQDEYVALCSFFHAECRSPGAVLYCRCMHQRLHEGLLGRSALPT
ncbi:hypothetical protein CCACVL1_20266 [Corchorus capsularis]|uniref:Uncharacterized protein n=1 Tax=Corchorus capsularis TaxID=210143 RepID=A0A1R3HC69_COCAP|nr:hypothetical protein CCACVL1_20266 [Corchorus capsularis]